MQRNIIAHWFASALLMLSGLFFGPAAGVRASVSADGLGNVYISGATTASLGGPNAGGADAFVSKYDAEGILQWTRQLGTSASDVSEGVSADGLGNVYISGGTKGSLGGPNAGDYDAFVSKYDAAGTLQWTRQLGTSAIDGSRGVSADGLGNVFISGVTTGGLSGPAPVHGELAVFVSEYDAAGSLQWIGQLGSENPGDDSSWGVSADGLGNIYISGWTMGNLVPPNPAGDDDAFVSKYDAAGSLQWVRQYGTSQNDQSWGVSADGLGNVYISGSTEGSLGGPNAGEFNQDAFVSKYDAEGNLQWTRQLGTGGWDVSWGVSADGLGNVYISGLTEGSLGGPNAGQSDALVSKYDAAGSLQWTRQLGTLGWDQYDDVSADGLGNVYISGSSVADLDAGDYDAFVSKYDAAGNLLWTRQLGVPEPATWLLAALASAGILRRGTRRSRCRISLLGVMGACLAATFVSPAAAAGFPASISFSSRAGNNTSFPTSQGYVDNWNALPTSSPGYGNASVALWDLSNNPPVANRDLIAGGSPYDVAYLYTVDFAIGSGQDGAYRIQVAPDFGFGGTVLLDGATVALNSNDMYGPDWLDPAQYFDFTSFLDVGNHTLQVYGQEACCDGPTASRVSNHGGATWEPFGTAVPEPAAWTCIALAVVASACGSRFRRVSDRRTRFASDKNSDRA